VSLALMVQFSLRDNMMPNIRRSRT
jgi:hypothetical protein